jgi:protein-S-isoprenylcysteine O-methyltransferase Ste14
MSQLNARATNASASTNNSSAGVVAPPPIVFLAAWVAAMVLHRIVPLETARGQTRPTRLLGGALAAAGVCLSAAVVYRFAKASTPVSPLRATRALVIDGPYRFSRNPDYLGQVLIYAGSSVIARRLWPLVLLPTALTIVTHRVIEREERYLYERFGAAYRSYAKRTPRWL